VAFRSVRRRSRHSNRGKSRKVHWEGHLFQGTEGFGTDLAGNYTWASSWARWPSDFIAPEDDTFPTPSDETVIRTITQFECSTSTNARVNVVFGLIAFDGGREPGFYEAALFDTSSLVAPPNPATDFGEDWLIRIPNNFTGLQTGAQSLYSWAQPESFIQSRAMRKMPPGTGLLAVIGAINVLGESTVLSLTWGADTRVALKSGYTR